MFAAVLALALCQSTPLDSILSDDRLSGALVSCVVTDDVGQTLYEKNSSLRLMPASNQKLLTNSYALAKLGPDYRPQTRIWKLKDRLVVDSPGDPMMTHERLQRAAKELGGNTKVPVYVREAYSPFIPPSWELDDLPNKYAAPITAFTVDRGSFEVWAQGEKIWLEPRNYGLRPVRGVKTGKPQVFYDPIRRTMLVNGKMPTAAGVIDKLALEKPNDSAALYLGGRRVATASVPTTPPTLILGGPPLIETMRECLTRSDNNIAENLLLMAALKDVKLGDHPYSVAPAQMRSFMIHGVGIDPQDFRPYDGSGMSRHNLVTTRGIAKLLLWDLQQPTGTVWLSALDRPGSGTLTNRLEGVDFAGKTGTLDMVVALSGYVKSKDNKTYIVSLILNHFLCTEKEARTIADKFIQKLYSGGAFGTVPATANNHEDRSAHQIALRPPLRRVF